jgi:exodeoxyribonuclease VII large subunit
LEQEGLFAAELKKDLPKFPRKIGVVTSADAAALRDILNVLKRRCPFVSVLIAPTLVQGIEAPPQIARALRWIDGREDIDVIILARGGGSIEDLWAFNSEDVIRAVFEARHPVICGVGHETDYTIADFVADVRAPTPSAAAELCVPDGNELRAYVGGLENQMIACVDRKIVSSHARVEALERNLRHLGPLVRINNEMQQVDTLTNRLDNAMSRRVERAHARLDLLSTRLASLGPEATLQRGYAIVRRKDGHIVRSIAQVTANEKLDVRVYDGEFSVITSSD